MCSLRGLFLELVKYQYAVPFKFGVSSEKFLRRVRLTHMIQEFLHYVNRLWRTRPQRGILVASMLLFRKLWAQGESALVDGRGG